MTVPSASLDDNVWHKAVVERRSKSVKVTVDNLSQGEYELNKPVYYTYNVHHICR